MRREEDRVLALHRVNRDADRRDVWAGDWNQRADHAGGLRVLDDALLGNLLDDAHALLTKRIAKNAEHLRTSSWLAAAHAALIDAHVGEPFGGFRVGRGPANRLAKTIDFLLVVVGNLLHRPAGVGKHALGA